MKRVGLVWRGWHWETLWSRNRAQTWSESWFTEACQQQLIPLTASSQSLLRGQSSLLWGKPPKEDCNFREDCTPSPGSLPDLSPQGVYVRVSKWAPFPSPGLEMSRALARPGGGSPDLPAVRVAWRAIHGPREPEQLQVHRRSCQTRSVEAAITYLRVGGPRDKSRIQCRCLCNQREKKSPQSFK